MSEASTTCIACGSQTSMFIERIWDDRYGCPGVFSILRCRACAQMVTVPPLTEADLPHLYSTYYPRREVDLDALAKEAARVLKPNAARKRWWSGTDNQGHYLARQGQRVLDVGSGSCLSLLELKNLKVEAFGIETDPNVRAIAEHFGLSVHIGSVHDHPFPGQVFDLITLSQVIEHIPDPRGMLRAVRERLTADGRLVLAFPNAQSLQRRLFGLRWLNWHIPYHQHHYNRRSFELIAKSEGYDVESARSITPNLWTLLQIRTLKRPVEGSKAGAWQLGSRATAGGSRLTLSRLARGLARRMGLLLVPLVALANRAVDRTGAGDSLMIVLKKSG